MPYTEKRISRVAALGCLICEMPAEIHHVRRGQGKSQRASDDEVLPLCPPHHRTGGYGVAFHAGKQIWQSLYGTEEELLLAVKEKLGEIEA